MDVQLLLSRFLLAQKPVCEFVIFFHDCTYFLHCSFPVYDYMSGCRRIDAGYLVFLSGITDRIIGATGVCDIEPSICIIYLGSVSRSWVASLLWLLLPVITGVHLRSWRRFVVCIPLPILYSMFPDGSLSKVYFPTPPEMDALFALVVHRFWKARHIV